jgi:hypothetical protein
MPRSWLARFQIVEYVRSFLLFRLMCDAQNGVTLISGAFGLFRPDAVIDVGGYDRTAIGEDMDLTIACSSSIAPGGGQSGSHSCRYRCAGRRRRGRLGVAARAAIPVAPWPAPGAVASSTCDRQPALWRRRAPVHHALRRTGTAARRSGSLRWTLRALPREDALRAALRDHCQHRLGVQRRDISCASLGIAASGSSLKRDEALDRRHGLGQAAGSVLNESISRSPFTARRPY